MVEAHLAWGWQPALYLFFGGLGAGMFITAAFMFFRYKEVFKKTIAITIWISVLSLGVGLLLLVLELTQPLRGLMLWQSFSHFDSWMTIGAWIVFAAMIVFALTAILVTDKLTQIIKPLAKVGNAVKMVLFGLGALIALGVAIYTGVLLMAAPGVPFWGSWLLPCLFTISAIDTGIAAVEVILFFQRKLKKTSVKVASKDTADMDTTSGVDLDAAYRDAKHSLNKKFEIGVILLVVLELVVLFLFLQQMLAGGNIASATMTYAQELAAYSSANALIVGGFAPVFWGLIVVCGLLLPLLAALSGLILKDKFGGINILVGAVGALAGGCALRFLILYAGEHADFLADAAYWLVY